MPVIKRNQSIAKPTQNPLRVILEEEPDIEEGTHSAKIAQMKFKSAEESRYNFPEVVATFNLSDDQKLIRSYFVGKGKRGADLRRLCSTLLGVGLGAVDLEDLIGLECQVSVVHRERKTGDGTYAWIEEVFPMSEDDDEAEETSDEPEEEEDAVSEPEPVVKRIIRAAPSPASKG
ncbi:MAG: hypothetical protein FD169_1844 [Bacillota bacterium]|nr:MAG: hypothetical protein FD169_1844 [Bacillota bacterium]